MGTFLSQATSGVQAKSLAVLIYGPEKSGKTTLVDSVDGLLMQPLEEGRGLLKTTALPMPKDFDEALAQVVEVATEDHDFKSIGVDSLSVLEELARKKVSTEAGKANIGEMSHGKGYLAVETLMGNYVEALQACRKKKMNVFVIAHAKNEHYPDPILGDYSRVEPAMHKRSREIWCRWVDIIGFLEVEKMAIDRGEEDRTVRTSMATGSRFLNLQENGSYIAGNRFGLPAQIEIPAENGWSVIRERIVANIKAAKGTTKKTQKKEAA